MRYIQPGRMEGADATATMGAAAGDLVVTEGIQKVRPGQVVAPVEVNSGRRPCCRDFHRSATACGRHFARHHHRWSAALTLIPVARASDIVPPQVSVSVSYPGASARWFQQSIAQPIESHVVGVDNMIYMKSIERQ